MYNEWFTHLTKSLQTDISLSLKVEMVQVKMNLFLSLPVYSLISAYNISAYKSDPSGPDLYLIVSSIFLPNLTKFFRGRSRTAATSKMEYFVIIVNCFQPLTIITKSSILDVAAILNPPLSHPTEWKSVIEETFEIDGN